MTSPVSWFIETPTPSPPYLSSYSDFEYEDQYGGDGVGVSINQDTGEVTPNALLGILPTANLFGLSENVSSVQLYWSSDKWYAQAIHNRRSGYFQQFTRDAFGMVRYTDTSALLDLRVRYKLTDNIRVLSLIHI